MSGLKMAFYTDYPYQAGIFRMESTGLHFHCFYRLKRVIPAGSAG